MANYLSKLRFNRDVWLVLITWALMGFAYTGVFLVLFNLYLLRLGYGPEFVGIVNGVGLIAALVSLPAGALGKRWGSRRLLCLWAGARISELAGRDVRGNLDGKRRGRRIHPHCRRIYCRRLWLQHSFFGGRRFNSRGRSALPELLPHTSRGVGAEPGR